MPHGFIRVRRGGCSGRQKKHGIFINGMGPIRQRRDIPGLFADRGGGLIGGRWRGHLGRCLRLMGGCGRNLRGLTARGLGQQTFGLDGGGGASMTGGRAS